MKRTRPATPELDRQGDIIKSGKAALIQDFIDWLPTVGMAVCRNDSGRTDAITGIKMYVNDYLDPEQLMADFFGIDRKKIEEERRSLLRDIREDHKVQDTIKRKATVQ